MEAPDSADRTDLPCQQVAGGQHVPGLRAYGRKT
jgi:hypothetical protein